MRVGGAVVALQVPPERLVEDPDHDVQLGPGLAEQERQGDVAAVVLVHECRRGGTVRSGGGEGFLVDPVRLDEVDPVEGAHLQGVPGRAVRHDHGHGAAEAGAERSGQAKGERAVADDDVVRVGTWTGICHGRRA